MKPVAIVTGGRRGIGRAIAEDLAKDYHVVVVAKSPPANVEGFTYIQVDLSHDLSIIHLVDYIDDVYGGCDVLVNCAGIQLLQASENISLAGWDAVLDVNLRAPFVLSQQAARRMKKYGGGKIINITSIAATRAARNIAPYVASKAGLAMLTQALACEWAKDNIQVNAIAPGFIETDMFQARSDLLERIPTGRFGTPADIVGAVRFLLSADYVHGTTITVDGGWSAKN
jgi:2-dehydro-3-deoxy-D-gluconate 5-dehydrogenase